MDNKYIGLIIGLVVGVLLIGSLLVPTINDATITEQKFDNTAGALGRVSIIDEESDYTFSWNPGSSSIEVNGQTIDMINNETIICKSADSMVRYTNGYFQYWSDALTTIGGPAQAFVLDITNGVMTISGDDISTITKDVVGGFILSDTGDYVLKSPTQKAYMNSDSPIVAMGVTTMTGNINAALSIVGTMGDIDITTTYPANVNFTFENVVVDSTAVSGYNDLYTLQKITFVANDGTNTTDCTYSYFIVPAEVTAELADHLSAGEIAMIAVIPVLMIASLLIFAVRFVTRD